MKLLVLKPIKLKKSGRLFDVSPGAIVEISTPEKAKTLIESGHVRPLLPDEVGKPYAVKIFSKVLDDTVWIITHPDAISFVPDGEIYYLPEEIRGIKGASPEEIRLIHTCKKELNGQLVSATEIKESKPIRQNKGVSHGK